MRQRPAKGGTAAMAGRRMRSRLRDAALPAVPTVRADEDKATAPTATPEPESEADAAVRRMVEAAYT